MEQIMNMNNITNTSLHNNLTEDGIMFEVQKPDSSITKFLLVNDIGEYFEKHEVDLDKPEESIIITTFEFKGNIYYIDWADVIYDTKTFNSIGVWDDLCKDINFC